MSISARVCIVCPMVQKHKHFTIEIYFFHIKCSTIKNLDNNCTIMHSIMFAVEPLISDLSLTDLVNREIFPMKSVTVST